jgi:hypothetical protein
MANATLPGFQVVSSIAPVVRRKHIAVSAGTKIRKNDAVIWGGASIAIATSTNSAIAGASMGASYINSAGARVESPNLPSTTYSGSTIHNPSANFIYLAEDGLNHTYLASSVSTALALTDIDLNLIMVLGTTTTKYSDHTATSASKNTTATFPWRLIGILDSTQADADTTPQNVLLKINAGMLEPALTAGTGV